MLWDFVIDAVPICNGMRLAFRSSGNVLLSGLLVDSFFGPFKHELVDNIDLFALCAQDWESNAFRCLDSRDVYVVRMAMPWFVLDSCIWSLFSLLIISRLLCPFALCLIYFQCVFVFELFVIMTRCRVALLFQCRDPVRLHQCDIDIRSDNVIL